MIVYAVAQWDNYYPEPDNVVKVFLDEDKAYKFLEELTKSSRRNNLDVFEYEVEE